MTDSRKGRISRTTYIHVVGHMLVRDWFALEHCETLTQLELVEHLVAAYPNRYLSPGWAVRALLDKAQQYMPKKSTGPISPLRAARLAEGRGWSLRFVAHKIHSNPTSLSEWERGIGTPSPEAQQALCKLYKLAPTELGFTSLEIEQTHEESLSRRAFLHVAIAIPILATLPDDHEYQQEVTGETLATLAAINERYRGLQLEGVVYSREQLQGHIVTIEHLLNTTILSRSRRELYRILAQAQLLACGGRTNPERLTLTEKAVSSAQQSGDSLLIASALSFLGQLYNFRIRRPAVAETYLSLSAQLARSDKSLASWVDVQRAESAAMLHQQGEVTKHLRSALDGVSSLGQQTDDRYYNTWSGASLRAYEGTCFLHLEDYERAANHFENTHFGAFSKVRRVVPLIDMAHVYTMLDSVKEACRYLSDALIAVQSTGHEALLPKIQAIANRLNERHPAAQDIRVVLERLNSIPTTVTI